MGYKLKRILIYPDGVTEKQVYPAGWKPGSNTLLYCPFNNDIIDYSGNNVTLTSTGTGFTDITSGGDKCIQITNISGYISGPGNLMSSIGTGDFAVSFWIKPTTSDEVVNVFANWYEGGSYPGCQMFMVYKNNWLTASNQVMFFMQSIFNPTSVSCTSLQGKWTHFCFTRLNGTCYSFINGQSVVTPWTDSTSLASNNTLRILNRGDASSQRWSTTGACMSNLIVEKVGWSSEYATKYVNSTKSNYGL